MHEPVKLWRAAVVLPTYPLPPPDKNPMFLERRVYQGSRGNVYPLPFHDRVAESKAPQSWEAVHLENEFIRVMMLPEPADASTSGRIKPTATISFTSKT